MSAHHHEHVHDHDHDHTHDHGHDHHHDEGDTYYLDQICMVGISGAFGAICLALYLLNVSAGQNGQSMLRLLLGPQFHPYVLGSGIALLFVALVRGVSLWRQAGQPAHVHTHDECCGHEHGIVAEGHAHHHHHDHHHHDHDAADHDHSWAPWRYVLLLVPIILFLLGLPNKGPEAREIAVKVDTTKETAMYAGMIASAPVTEAQVLMSVGAMTYFVEGNAQLVDFKDLLQDAKSPAKLKMYEKEPITVRVRGQFAPSPSSDHVFSIGRFQIACCGADAQFIPIPVLSRDALSNRTDGLSRSDWINLTGVVEVQNVAGRPTLLLRVMNQRGIEKCAPDPNPYIQ